MRHLKVMSLCFFVGQIVICVSPLPIVLPLADVLHHLYEARSDCTRDQVVNSTKFLLFRLIASSYFVESAELSGEIQAGGCTCTPLTQ